MSKKETIARLNKQYDAKITEFAVATKYGDRAGALLALAQAGEIKGKIRHVRNQKFDFGQKLRERRTLRELDELYSGDM